MNKETLRMQMLAGLITESQYKSKLGDIQESKLSPERQSILNNLIDDWVPSWPYSVLSDKYFMLECNKFLNNK